MYIDNFEMKTRNKVLTKEVERLQSDINSKRLSIHNTNVLIDELSSGVTQEQRRLRMKQKQLTVATAKLLRAQRVVDAWSVRKFSSRLWAHHIPPIISSKRTGPQQHSKNILHIKMRFHWYIDVEYS